MFFLLRDHGKSFDAVGVYDAGRQVNLTDTSGFVAERLSGHRISSTARPCSCSIRDRPPLDRALDSCNARTRLGRDVCSAGIRPNSRLAATHAPRQKRNTIESIATDSRRGNHAGVSATSGRSETQVANAPTAARGRGGDRAADVLGIRDGDA
jgi:hypothetical protein